jgi:hypothetical protein
MSQTPSRSNLLEHIRVYIARRKSEGMASGTINSELAALKRMFRLASQHTLPLVAHAPHIPHLEENNVRRGSLPRRITRFSEPHYRII